MRIDVHTHVQPAEYLQALLESGRYEVERAANDQLVLKEQGARVLTIAPREPSPEERVAAMDAAGIDGQVLSVGAPQVYFRQGQEALDLAARCNDHLAAMVQAYPTRFRALASIPFSADVDSAIAELARCMDELGMPGFVIGSNVDGSPIDDPKYDPFYEEANRRGAVMFVHPMIPAGAGAMNQYMLAPLVGEALDTTLAVARLVFSNFFGRFVGMHVVVAQLGGAIPFLVGQLNAGFATFPECQTIARPPEEVIERLYLDTVAGAAPALRLAVETVGSEQVLFGSDYPNALEDPATAMKNVESAVGRRERGRILGDNAAKIFRFEG